MTVFLTGDTHGSIDIRKLARRRFDPDGLTRDDYMIVLGDFGLVWHDPPSGEERYWLDWLEERPWTTLFIDGNHENHVLLDSLPEFAWHGGRVHKVREHVLHLMRGETFEIGGATFFCMGGAYSHDKEWRTPGWSWWEEEVPSNAERVHALDTLDATNWSVDYVLTHCPPTGAFRTIHTPQDSAPAEADEYADWLERIATNLEFKRWFYGHMHVDNPDAFPYTALYNNVIELLPGGEIHKSRMRKPLLIPPSEHPLGYSIEEIAGYIECPFEAAEQAVQEALRGQTLGLHPETGKILVYRSDVHKVLLYLERRLG